MFRKKGGNIINAIEDTLEVVGAVSDVISKPRKLTKIEKSIQEILPDISENLVNRATSNVLNQLDMEKSREINEENQKRRSTLTKASKLIKDQKKIKDRKEIEVKPSKTDLILISSAYIKDYENNELVYFLPVEYDWINKAYDKIAPCQLPNEYHVKHIEPNKVEITTDDEVIIYDMELKAIVDARKL